VRPAPVRRHEAGAACARRAGSCTLAHGGAAKILLALGKDRDGQAAVPEFFRVRWEWQATVSWSEKLR